MNTPQKLGSYVTLSAPLFVLMNLLILRNFLRSSKASQRWFSFVVIFQQAIWVYP